MALFALAEINYCQGNFFPLVAEIADGTSDASRVTVVKSCLLWPKCRMVWPKSREHVLPIEPLVAVIAKKRHLKNLERAITATRGTLAQKSARDFGQTIRHFGHKSHDLTTGVRRAVGNFGHKRKNFALAVIDFGQGKKCRFSWIFFLQEQSWPKISKIWFRRGKSQKFETHVGQWKIGFIEHSLRYTRRWIVRKRASLYQDSIEIHMIMSGEYRV